MRRLISTTGDVAQLLAAFGCRAPLRVEARSDSVIDRQWFRIEASRCLVLIVVLSGGYRVEVHYADDWSRLSPSETDECPTIEAALEKAVEWIKASVNFGR